MSALQTFTPGCLVDFPSEFQVSLSFFHLGGQCQDLRSSRSVPPQTGPTPCSCVNVFPFSRFFLLLLYFFSVGSSVRWSPLQGKTHLGISRTLLKINKQLFVLLFLLLITHSRSTWRTVPQQWRSARGKEGVRKQTNELLVGWKCPI